MDNFVQEYLSVFFFFFLLKFGQKLIQQIFNLMGCFIEKMGQHQAIIGSLNYSGIQDSPYEFFQTENQHEKEIDKIFAQVCEKNIKNFNDPKFKWQIGKFDKEWHTRYTPIYFKQCGVKENKKMMNQEQFFSKWEEVFNLQFPKYEGKIYGKVTKEQRDKALPIEKNQCKLFDFCIYQTIVRYVYKTNDIKTINEDSKQYLKHQNSKFHKAFLDQELKLTLTMKSIKQNRIDLFFIQEGNQNLRKELENFSDKFYVVQKLSKNCTSMIMIRRQKFDEVKDFQKQNTDFCRQYHQKCGGDAQVELFWNSDTVFQVIGHNLLISTHLSSKKQKNIIQIKEMRQSLTKLKKHLPEYEFIIGGDLNGDLQFGFQIISGKGITEPINVFPDKDNDATVNKKRTLVQAQKHKANQLSNGVKDYIVTSYPFVTRRITTVNNIEIKKDKKMPLLPNAEHPYDHYLVAAKIKMK